MKQAPEKVKVIVRQHELDHLKCLAIREWV